MNIRTILAQIANEMDTMGMHGEADALDSMLHGLPDDIDEDVVTPESVLQRPDAAYIINEARGWVGDNSWDDQDDIGSYSDFAILRGVERHYAGGLKQFLQDINPV